MANGELRANVLALPPVLRARENALKTKMNMKPHYHVNE